jgi:ribosomal protein S18 acetylase RimI-like enzyme
MTVIEADASHVEYLSDFGSKSFIYAYQCTLPLEKLKKYIQDAFSESIILEEINGSLATYFICQDSNSNPCGYAKLIQSATPDSVHSDSMELQRLYVDSDYRGHGVGKRLETQVETYSSNHDIHSLWLRVWEGNVVAQDIYKKWGFEIVGEEQYQVGEDQRTVLIMNKPISGQQ